MSGNRSTGALWCRMVRLQARPPGAQAVEKGPAARRRPKAAGEAYSLYVEPAAEGANEADAPLSTATAQAVEKGPAARRRPMAAGEA